MSVVVCGDSVQGVHLQPVRTLVWRTLSPFGWADGQGLESDYKRYLRVRGLDQNLGPAIALTHLLFTPNDRAIHVFVCFRVADVIQMLCIVNFNRADACAGVGAAAADPAYWLPFTVCCARNPWLEVSLLVQWGLLALALRCLAIPDILLRWGCREGDSREEDGVFWCKECGWLEVSLLVQWVCLLWRCGSWPSRTSCSGGFLGKTTVYFGARIVVWLEAFPLQVACTQNLHHFKITPLLGTPLMGTIRKIV